jgi:hypothetical protein
MKGRSTNRTIAAVLLVAGAGLGVANAMHLGVGPMIGVPLGISAKLYTAPSLALDAGVGYSWFQDSSIQVHGDLMFHSHHLTSNPSEEGALGVYVGLGAQVRMAGDSKNPVVASAFRMPIGFEYIFPSARFSLYAEAVPRFNLGTTDQYFGGDAVFGFRFYWTAG